MSNAWVMCPDEREAFKWWFLTRYGFSVSEAQARLGRKAYLELRRQWMVEFRRLRGRPLPDEVNA